MNELTGSPELDWATVYFLTNRIVVSGCVEKRIFF